MKIIPISSIPDISFPLPIWSSVHIADAIGKDGQEFSACAGLEEKYAKQLKELSLQKSDVELGVYTRDGERFGEGSYEEWYKKNRTPFALIHKQSDSLAALVWFGPAPLYENETGWQTAAWRCYKPFRGTGLMNIFTKFAMEIYEKSVPGKFWVMLKRENLSSVKLAEELGFQVVAEESDAETLVMVR